MQKETGVGEARPPLGNTLSPHTLKEARKAPPLELLLRVWGLKPQM